jgi:hypothetical protein
MTKHSVKAEIDRLVEELEVRDPSTPEYGTIVENISELSKVNSNTLSNWLKPELIVPAIVHIGGTLLVLYYEELHVIGSRAFNNIAKMRMP